MDQVSAVVDGKAGKELESGGGQVKIFAHSAEAGIGMKAG
jgi:hypothetical protein